MVGHNGQQNGPGLRAAATRRRGCGRTAPPVSPDGWSGPRSCACAASAGRRAAAPSRRWRRSAWRAGRAARPSPPGRRAAGRRGWGGWPHLDLEHALRHGVALEEDAPWSEFLPRFERFRAQRRAEFAAARRAQGQAADADGETEALIAYEESLSPSRERRQREESFFYRDLPAVEAGRARVRELLAGFAVHRSTFASMVPGPQDAAECRRLRIAASSSATDANAWQEPVLHWSRGLP
jgi:hypothetical protein